MSDRIVSISAAETRPIRGAVLRPGQPAERLIYPDDNNALHLGAIIDDQLVAVASFYQQPIPDTTAQAWRIRGMATLPENRGNGLGRRLVEAGLKQAQRIQQGPAWCNARTTAAGYYQRLGFQQLGDTFDIPDIGPHVVMVLEVAD